MEFGKSYLDHAFDFIFLVSTKQGGFLPVVESSLKKSVGTSSDVSYNSVSMEFDPPLDPGIRKYVEILHAAGIETYESCEGGQGHAYTEPAVRFHGSQSVGFKAFNVAREHGLPA